MRVLFDQATPVPLRLFLEGHTIRTAAQERWHRLSNGELLDAAESAGFRCPCNHRQKHSLSAESYTSQDCDRGTRKTAMPELRKHVALVVAAVNAAALGSYTEVEMP